MRLGKMFGTWFLASLATLPVLGLEVWVKDYGAKGDGSSDDRAAIQAAIDTVRQGGGGTVFFPEGSFIVTAPNKEGWQPQVTLCSNLRLRGVGMFKSVIRVADRQGAYDVIFGGRSLEGFSMLDLGIDANGEANPVVSEEDSVPSPYKHMLLHLPAAKNVSIQRCRFTNLSGVWAIFAPRVAENVTIDSCLFDNIGGFTKNDWDHSCIRVDGNGSVISNNVLTSRFGAGTTGARTAVEIHGSNHKFIHNLISGFRYGVNACSGGEGHTSEPSVHQYYLNNRLVHVGCGFCIWGIRNRRFDNLVFERNDVTIDMTNWREFFPDFFGIGVVSYRGTPPPVHMENVRIADNCITYINTEGGKPRSFAMRFDFSVYTDRWSENPDGRMVNVRICRNMVSGAYASGIDLNCVAKNVEIAENTIIDPARGVRGDQELSCAIRLRNTLENTRIVNNMFYTHGPNPIACGVYDAATHVGSSVMANNRLSGAGTAKIPEILAAPTRSGANWKADVP